MAEASTITTGVEEAVDPMFDPVLDKRVIVKGVEAADDGGRCDFDDRFTCIHRGCQTLIFAELVAQTTVVDSPSQCRASKTSCLTRHWQRRRS